jgi:hypothetical protein
MIINFIKKIKNIFYSNFPKLTKIIGILLNKKSFSTFSGWGMTTTGHFPPWANIVKQYNIHNFFLKADQKIRLEIQKKKFLFSKNFINNNLENIYLDELRWRHYIACWSVIYASTFTKSKKKILVECGVEDGLLIFYVINNIIKYKKKYKCFLYDSWAGMRKINLTPKEINSRSGSEIGKFSYLKLENAVFNLKKYRKNIIFNKGYIPEVFKKKINHPKKITWLSIDLNSSQPTLSALNFFYNKLEKNGVILLDDYGGAGYIETKKIVDQFMSNKKSKILPLPTGQAIIFKK